MAIDREALIKPLCEEIAAEENPLKLKLLLRCLRRTVEAERDETRLRMRLIAREYRERLASAPRGVGMLDVLKFLGLARKEG